MLDRLTPAARLMGGSAIAVAIGAFLPWVSLFGVSAMGIEGDGAITLVCALAGLGALTAHAAGKFPRKAYLIVSAVGAGISALVGLADMNGAAAIGLYLTMFGGIAWVVGVVWEIRLGRQEQAPITPSTP